ncbi:MAG TPA: S8 family serine peptidase [Acidimicrobiia bacterium]|nr:S8 family serine peptidase [Acidimicrobiia bacterium]
MNAEPLAGLDLSGAEAVERRRRLDSLEAGVLRTAAVSEANVGYRYRTTLAGFSARLTAGEAQLLRRRPEVASVTGDRVRVMRHRQPESAGRNGVRSVPPLAATASSVTAPVTDAPANVPVAVVDTSLAGHTADFLGLPEGLWARLGGPDHAGEDVVVGVIDGGIYPEHPSFADEPVAADGSVNYIGPAYGPPPATWRGICQEGEAFPATSCNNKLIGARFFVDGWGAANVADQEFLSPRDADGHGTGTASTAAGNFGVDPSYLGNDLGLGVITGIAPRARIAHYKALWAVPAWEGAGFGAESDLVAAVDAAVADGVDIISMSIGEPLGDTLPFSDQSTMRSPWATSLLRAYDAGVLTVAPAGNDGPDEGSVESPGHTPWTISAGASALPTTFLATATVSAGPAGPVVTATGVSPTPALPAVPLIDGAAAAAPGQDPARAARCADGTLDPALVRGKAVLCRPVSVLIASATLFDLGAAGGVFYFQAPTFRYTADDVWLPSIVVSRADAEAMRQLISTNPDATVALTAGTLSPTTTGDIVRSYSGRGPAIGSESILKPDLLAPGDDVIVAHSPDVPPNAGDLFDYAKAGLFRPLGGTSFSVPNIAGAAALLLDLHPDFGPAELKSSLMTTAEPRVFEDTAGTPSVPATPHDIGSGRMDPNRAADPGLVVTETSQRFQDYAAGQDPARDPAVPTIDASDLNLPSIAFDPLVAPQSTSRTFTSVDGAPGAWTVSVEGLAGIDATASPADFSLEPGQSRSVDFTFAPNGAPPGSYVYGAVVLTHADDGRTVRLPVVLRPESFEAPEQVNFGAGQPDGSAPLPVPTGYDGQLSALGYGLAAPVVRPNQTVGEDAPDEDLARIAQPGPGVTVFDLQVPVNAKALGAEIGGKALADPFADLDLYVFHDDEENGFDADDIVDQSATSSSRETVLVFSPSPGSYRISVRGFNAFPTATFDLTTWLLDDPSPDVLTDPPGPGLEVGGDPVTVTPGGVATLDFRWTGLDEPGVYVGLVTFHDTPAPNPGDVFGETVVVITRR